MVGVVVACSLMFHGIGLLLGGMCIYLILRWKGRSSGSYPISSPPLSPTALYEDVKDAGGVERSHNIQLTPNEAYGPIKKDTIHTSRNAAYGQVQL